MNFRRIPFQFNVTDPAEKRSELMRKFGTPDENMLVTAPCESLGNATDSVSSPRFQHRLPEYFNEGQSMRSANGADSVDSNKQQPRVRVIPIQVEGSSNSYPSRQRTKSGDTFNSPQRLVCDNDFRHRSNSGSNVPVTRPSHCRESQAEETGSPRQTPPRVHNIPVVIEGKNGASSTKPKSSSCVNIPIQKEVSNSKVAQKPNGPCISKGKQSVVKKDQAKPAAVDPKELSLRQVEAVLKEFQSYKEAVSKFIGNQRDKEYRYLDEMLTRCMLKLDDVETHGNEDVRKARKAAVKEVQDCINDLEAKVLANIGSSDNETAQIGATEAKEETLEITDVETAGIGITSDQNEASQGESSNVKYVDMAVDLAKGDMEEDKLKGEPVIAESSNMDVNMGSIGTQELVGNTTADQVATEEAVQVHHAKLSETEPVSHSSDCQPKEEIVGTKDIQPLEVDSAKMSELMETETIEDTPKDLVPVEMEGDELVPVPENSASEVKSKSDSLDIEKSAQSEAVLESGDSDAVVKPAPCDQSELSSNAADNEVPCESDVKSDIHAVEKMDCC